MVFLRVVGIIIGQNRAQAVLLIGIHCDPLTIMILSFICLLYRILIVRDCIRLRPTRQNIRLSSRLVKSNRLIDVLFCCGIAVDLDCLIPLDCSNICCGGRCITLR